MFPSLDLTYAVIVVLCFLLYTHPLNVPSCWGLTFALLSLLLKVDYVTDLCCPFAEHAGLAFICATVFLVELTFEATIVGSLNAY